MTLWASVREDGLSLPRIARRNIGPLSGVTTSIATLFIIVCTLASVGIVVVNALAESAWGMFTIAVTVPAALLTGLWMYKIRPGRVAEASVIGVTIVMLICLFPFAWMGLSSIKVLSELYTIPPHWWPDMPTLDNYAKVLFDSNIPKYFLNSVIISVGSTGLALILAIFASYGFARFEFRGKPLFQAFVLIGQLLPTAAIIVPLFITLRAP